jgi:hypothetical protein
MNQQLQRGSVTEHGLVLHYRNHSKLPSACAEIQTLVNNQTHIGSVQPFIFWVTRRDESSIRSTKRRIRFTSEKAQAQQNGGGQDTPTMLPRTKMHDSGHEERCQVVWFCNSLLISACAKGIIMDYNCMLLHFVI